MKAQFKIPKSRLDTLRKRLESIAHRGDSLSIWGLPTTGTSVQLRQIQGKLDGKTEFVYLDTQMLTQASPENFHSLLNSYLGSILKSKDTETSKDQTLLTRELIERIVSKGNLCIIIDTLEHLSSSDESFFLSLKSFRDKYHGHGMKGSLSFVFVSNRPLHEHPHFKDYTRFVDFACHSEIVLEPFNDKDSLEIINSLQKQFKSKLSKKELENIVDLGGGICGLLKAMLRILYEEGETDTDLEFFMKKHPIKARLARIYDSFTARERAHLRAVAEGKKTPDVESQYLTESGVLERGKIRSPLLKKYVLQQEAEAIEDEGEAQVESTQEEEAIEVKPKVLEIDFVSGEIRKNGQRLSEILSETEIRIVKSMRDSNDSITTREDIAKLIWGKDAIEKYSDWAIDKTISRIRKKIRDNKHPYKHLVTLKKKGFKLYL